MLLERGVNHYGLALTDVITMMTKTPSTILGLTDRGVIENGYRADVVLFDKDYRVVRVLLDGKQYV